MCVTKNPADIVTEKEMEYLKDANERQTRQFAAIVAERIGIHGVAIVCYAFGVSRNTVYRGLHELQAKEHLDEGKDLLTAILEANDYSDYILDRRLACRQLGMNLPRHVGFGQFTEKYTGKNQYFGTTVRAYYYVRQYVQGVASDKVPVERFHNPAFALKFAELMGEAAALDLVVGRRATETNEPLFDKNYEVLQIGPKGLPVRLVVTDHAGSFVDYQTPLEKNVAPYANVVRRREKYVFDFAEFAKPYVEAFERRLAAVQKKYRERRAAFDDLFAGRPYDQAGSGAYRWTCVLKRLDECDPATVAAALKLAIQS